MKTILAFGDSITYGSWGITSSGWADLLRKHLDQQVGSPDHYLYVLGIPGETSTGLAKRFEQEVIARQRSDDDHRTFIIACGANDATWLNGEARFKETLDNYKRNLGKIVEQAVAFDGDILLLNITPVNEEFSRTFKGKDKTCLNEYVDMYNAVLDDIARKQPVRLVDVNGAFRREDVAALLCNDGLHPNDTGHELIFRTLAAALKL